jgi:uncharacterized protein YraI
MKKVKLLIAGLAIIFTAGTSWAQSNYRINASSGANLRQGPDANRSVITTIPNGANVRIIERTNDKWVKVEYDGKTGYVASELVKQDSNKSNNNSSASKPKSNNSSSSKKNSGNSNKSSASSRSGSNSSAGSSQSKNWGVGLRLGDPTGLTVKKYNGNAAFELNIGSSPNWGYYHYDRRFSYYDKYEGYVYKGYDRAFATSVQLHYLKHIPISGINNLDFYYGGGAQVRFTKVLYWYDYKSYYGPGKGDYEWFRGSDASTFVDLGLDGKIGLEYTFSEVPLSLFVDANLYLELYYKPLWATGMGGAGIRYNF